MELLQIIASSVFLFSLFGFFLLVISFTSYRLRRNNHKLILQPIRQNPSYFTQITSDRIPPKENLKCEDRNSFNSNKFTVINKNPIVRRHRGDDIHRYDVSAIYLKAAEIERLRPAKFYSLDELK